MNNLTLNEAIPNFIKRIREIKQHPETQADQDFIDKLLNAEEILESLRDGIEVSKVGVGFAKMLETDLVDPSDPTVVKVNNKFTYKFDHIRLLIIRGIMSSTWGVYDNVKEICHILVGPGQSKYNPKNLLDFLLSNETKIPNSTLGPIRQRYKYPLSLSYQLRNSTIHRLPIICGRVESFLSNFVKDGFIVKSEKIRMMITHCQERDKVTDKEVLSYDFVTNQDQCLIKLLEDLQLHTDKCALELLELSLKPFLSNKHIHE